MTCICIVQAVSLQRIRGVCCSLPWSFSQSRESVSLLMSSFMDWVTQSCFLISLMSSSHCTIFKVIGSLLFSHCTTIWGSVQSLLFSHCTTIWGSVQSLLFSHCTTIWGSVQSLLFSHCTTIWGSVQSLLFSHCTTIWGSVHIAAVFTLHDYLG